MTTVSTPRQIATSATTSATLAKGKHTPVDATSGALTMTLPTTAAAGVEVSVEKTDASTNAVTISGTLRGASSSTITLTTQFEGRTFLSEGGGSWRPISDHRTKSSLDASYMSAVAMVGAGIDPTGVADSTTAIQAKLDSLPAAGGVVFFPPGTYKIGSLNLSRPTTVLGSGGALLGDGALTPIRAITTLVSASPTADAITVSAVGCTMRDFALVNDASSTPTAGAGIKAIHPNASQGTLNGVTVVGFWNLAQLGGVYWTVTGCHFYDPVNYGVYMPKGDTNYNDHGDMGFTNTVISSMYKTYTAAAFMRWECGGGLRITGSKLNGGGQPYKPDAGRPAIILDIAVADGVATGCFVISGNSLSGGTVAQIRLGQTGTTKDGLATKISIIGNDIGVGYGTGDGVIAGYDNAHISAIRAVIIDGNNFAGVVSSIAGGACSNLVIGRNVHDGVTQPIRLDQYNGTFRRIAPQDVAVNASQVLSIIQHTLDQQPLQFDNVEHDYSYPFSLSSGTPGRSLFIFKGAQGSSRGGSFFLDVNVEGYYDGVGAVFIRASRAFTFDATGALVTTTIGTDATAGAGSSALTLGFLLGTGNVTLQVTGPGGAVAINGVMHVRARGFIQQVNRG